ncbi:MAG: DUF4091 domain-containing protein [Candidatus Dadabacteria bacterium]|nr:MAG: DUF4091 domain-containing protein [Candidatus Dadabacteria bacterium]
MQKDKIILGLILRLAIIILVALLSGCGGSSSGQGDFTRALFKGPDNITAIWANDGLDKVLKGEVRASSGANTLNSLWDGSSINIFGAKNEVVSFNLILEAAGEGASRVSVTFDSLLHDSGYTITSRHTSGDGVFNFVGRNIELFYVRYLQIKGLSLMGYDTYDERHIPPRLRRPYQGEGFGSGSWQDRPAHDSFYPDIAVPLELVGNFDIAAGSNQSIWADIYIPRDAPAGKYHGEVTVDSGSSQASVPVILTVRNFSLPDVPASRTMLYLGYEDVSRRYIGSEYPQDDSQKSLVRMIRDRHFMLAHRHKISLIDSDNGPDPWPEDSPRPQWRPRLDGSLFTAANGYDGPGVGVGNLVYSIGTYGTWTWKDEGQAAMQEHARGWVEWFEKNSPQTSYFLYLIDESSNFSLINRWASWINSAPAPANRLRSFATIELPDAVRNTPELDIAAGTLAVGVTSSWQNALNTLKANSDKAAFLYNGRRPASGSFATDDHGTALRELPWGQYKKGIDCWFYWESTYYNNFQGGTGETNVFKQAQTFGGFSGHDPVLGDTGHNYSNGDGVLFYPGTDRIFPEESYGINGPIASLRLKYWRRGIQDIDYIVLASRKNPRATAEIVNSMVPSVLWEPGVSDPADPSWVRKAPSWPENSDRWEEARKKLADIIAPQ